MYAAQANQANQAIQAPGTPPPAPAPPPSCPKAPRKELYTERNGLDPLRLEQLPGQRRLFTK